MPDIAFDEATHTYRVDGRPVPSVTTILSVFDRSLARVPKQTLEAKGRIGTAVHRACELDDKGALDESSLHPVIAPYLEMWRKFRAEVPITVEHNEEFVFNDLHNYIGTADRLIRYQGDRAVLDIKTGMKSHWHALQTAAYAAAAERQYQQPVTRRFSLHLMPDRGTYAFVEHTRTTDRPTFLGAVALYHFMQANGDI